MHSAIFLGSACIQLTVEICVFTYCDKSAYAYLRKSVVM